MNYKGVKDASHNCLNCGVLINFRGYGKRRKHLFCDNKCQMQLKHKNNIDKCRELFYNGRKIKRCYIYVLLVERDGNECSVCHTKIWNQKPIRFWVDHIDGNAGNNKPDNFRLVCPNCDSQSETFGAKNFGNGRKSRGMRQYD